MSKHLTRQFDLIPLSCLSTPITVIGSGAIGSLAALQLAKMGFCNIRCFDFDKVDVENMNCQFYRFKDIGKPKVHALRELIHDFTGTEIEATNERYTGEETFAGIVISAVDSMEGRKKIWEAHLESPSTIAVLDARMGAEQAMFFAMRPMDDGDREAYPKSLYSDQDAVQEPCTAKAVMYTAAMISGLVAKTAKDLAAGFRYTRTATWQIKLSQFTGWMKDFPGQESVSGPGADALPISSAEALAEPV